MVLNQPLHYFCTMLSKYKYHFLLHFIILMWGFTGILGKLIELDPITIVWHRLFIAVIALAIAMPLLKRSFRVASWKQLLSFAIVGIIVALHWVTFYISIELSTASLGILCLSTVTIHVAWLEPLIMKRQFSWVELLLSSIVIYGIYFVSGDFDSKEYEALIYGLISALLAAIFAVFNAKFAETSAPSKITFYELLAGLIFLSFLLMYNGDFGTNIFVMTTSDFLWLLFLGIVCTSFAFLVAVELTRRLGAFLVSLTINLEPVYTILLAIVILNENENVGAKFYIGSSIIVLVVIANALIKRLQRKRTANLPTN
ncbi:MAG: drug/metabolite transporter (DMT)-like permease [Flavobacteriaceae bacterium]|jgi:drug/metabolite transporter (DMT)-like permease